MAANGEETLLGRWVHSHEEDTDDEMVFRPATYAFPPSRGRTSFEFRPDGRYAEKAPGPVDVPEESGGRWSLEVDRVVLEADADMPDQTWEIAAAESGRLALRRVGPGRSP